MKKFRTYSNAFLVTVLTIAFTAISCNKEIELTEQLSAYTPVSADANAGNWDMTHLTTPVQVVVPAPASPTSDAYQAELAAIKDSQSKLTKGQRDIIKYWSAGGVVRWNQIMRKLVAQYSLPPAPKADGSYPVPDAENPFADPAFPFANPPYAARAYSYVSVAIYDALKSAWHYKYQYNRPQPNKVDVDIQLLMPDSGVPAYPSEDATISGAAAEMLKSLFPAAVEEITKLAAEQRNAALWSGKAAASDISAGLALGKGVAALLLTRAGGDNMRFAGGNKSQWDALAQLAIDKGEMPWMSQDSPKRPPMLPNFGQVRAWNMSQTDIVNNRPSMPPSTSSSQMLEELAEVKFYANNTTRERLAICHKWADGAGTYTPPGHWNDIACEYIVGAKWSEVRTARAFALLNMAMHDAAVGCWETKFFYFNPRPSQLDPTIKTITGLPNFPSYTSGHSTFSGAAATVLSYLFPSEAEYLFAQASEASVSRLYGGIHYRSDIEMGMTHGKVIGAFTVNYALIDGAN